MGRQTESVDAPPTADPAERESVTVFRPPYLPGVEVWRVQDSVRLWRMFFELYSFSAQDPANPEWNRARNFTQHRGRTREYSRCGMLLGAPGDLLLMKRVMGAELWSFHAINVDPSTARELIPAGRDLELAALHHEPTYRAFVAAWRAVEAPVLDVTEREHHLREFLGRAFRSAVAGSASVRERAPSERLHVRRAREFLQDSHTVSGLRLADVAAAVGRSVSHLDRCFGQSVGMPMHVYLQRVRVGRALTLLRAGRRPAEVAVLVGFADQAHLTRSFRQQLGLTPGAYRRARVS